MKLYWLILSVVFNSDISVMAMYNGVMNKVSARNNRPAIKLKVNREIPNRSFKLNTDVSKIVQALKIVSTSSAKANN